jgi:hypothetical protein
MSRKTKATKEQQVYFKTIADMVRAKREATQSSNQNQPETPATTGRNKQ